MIGLRRDKFTITCPEDLIALTVTMVTRKAARRWKQLKREREFLELQKLLMAHRRPVDNSTAHLEHSEQLQILLAELGDLDRQLLKLYLEGHSTVEAASILGLNRDVLRVRRSRLFKKLQVRGWKIGRGTSNFDTHRHSQ
jgi:DNA-directed RNA polymerase specialized sigma24 family protein